MQLGKWVEQMAKVLDGGAVMHLEAYPGATEEMYLAEANAHAAGTVTKIVRFALEDRNGELQQWFNGTVRFNSTEVITDGDCAAPGINVAGDITDIDIVANNGIIEVTLIFDTAAAGHDYADQDTVTVTPEALNVAGVAVDLTTGVCVITFVSDPI